MNTIYIEVILGPPVLFGRDYFSGLQTLSGDVGAKSLIYQNLADVAAVPFPLGWLDIDTVEDYAWLKALEAGESI